MNVKIDTYEYVLGLKQLIEEDHEVVITVAGWSMTPFLRNQRDRVLLKKPMRPLKVGDIVFYQRKTGQFVLHRIYKIKSDGYYMMGDHLIDLEGPIAADAIFAIVTEVERNGHWHLAEAFSWKFPWYLWRAAYPLRKLAVVARKAIRK